MNPDGLLKHFDEISEAPDALPRLRRFILDLAVRGKLVPQDQNDEPASELLKRIETEKEKITKPRSGSGMGSLDIAQAKRPFEIPSVWKWVAVRQVTADRGQKIPDKDFSYVDVSSIDKERGRIYNRQVLSPDEAPSRARKLVQIGDVIYSCVRPYLLNIAMIEETFEPEPIVSTAFAVLNGFGLVLPRYLWMVLRSPFFVACVEEKMRGQAYPAINDRDFALVPIPLPPLAEQRRIVAKVDELMGLCDQLEAAQAKRERCRGRLVAASLHGLNNGASGEEVRQNAGFYMNHLPRLTTRPEHIHQLRHTILNLAVRGKLVPQGPNDEPAFKLLERIEAERARLIKAGEIRKMKPLPPVNKNEVPFAMPEGWLAVRLMDLCEVITKGSSPKWQGIEYTDQQNGILFITSENVGNFTLRLEKKKYVNRTFNEIEPRSILAKNDILLNLVGASIGRCAIFHLEMVANINQAVCIVRTLSRGQLLSLTYLLILLNSEFGVSYMLDKQVDMARANLSMANVARLPILLPPLAEQHRIAAKVEEVMALCDELETQITNATVARQRLLEASLQEALGFL